MTLWRTGTVKVSGKGEYLDVVQRLVEEFALPDTVAETQIPADLPRDAPWAGVDESGKGDYFGPLVSAAVVVTPHAAAELAAAGVQDSKRLTDKRVAKLAPLIRKETQYAVTTLGPERYNEFYADARKQGMRLNQVLAWAHVRSLRSLLEREVGFAYAIVDQFADARVVETAAAPHTGDLRIVQFPRAEADVAVAAASILARKAFVDWLERESSERGIELPRGASDRVIDAARELVERDGEDVAARSCQAAFRHNGKGPRMSPTVGDFIIERLHAWGAERIFGYPGDGITGITSALRRA